MTDKLSQLLDAISSKVSKFESDMLDKYIPVECSTFWNWRENTELNDYIGFAKVKGEWRLCVWYSEDQETAIPVLELSLTERLEVLDTPATEENAFYHVEKALNEAQSEIEQKAAAVLDCLNR